MAFIFNCRATISRARGYWFASGIPEVRWNRNFSRRFPKIVVFVQSLAGNFHVLSAIQPRLLSPLFNRSKHIFPSIPSAKFNHRGKKSVSIWLSTFPSFTFSFSKGLIFRAFSVSIGRKWSIVRLSLDLFNVNCLIVAFWREGVCCCGNKLVCSLHDFYLRYSILLV